MLNIDHISVRYGNRLAVNDVSFTLGAGLHALLGQNGAGKTSLLEVIATLKKPSSGKFSLGGAVWPGGKAENLRAKLGYLPQENMEKSRFTVREHLFYMCWLRKLDKSEAPAEVERILGLIGLSGRRDERIKSLSGGMRRRVGIGSALVGDPELVILDEPSAGLDVGQRGALREITRKISENSIVIVSTHLVEDVLNVADTVTVMDNGRVKRHCPRCDFAPMGDLSGFEKEYLRLVDR